MNAARWLIESEFRDNKSLVGLDEYEVRSWYGWHHHIACCLLANAFLLSLEQDIRLSLEQDIRGDDEKGGDSKNSKKKMPEITRPQVYRIVREILPRKHFDLEALIRWLLGTQSRNAAAKKSHIKRRTLLAQAGLLNSSL